MKIRQANKFDIPHIIRMLKNYRLHSPLPCLVDADNEEYIVQLLSQIIVGRGVIFVADYVDVPVGMIIGIRNPNAWDPDILAFNEMAYWVEVGHRNSSAGYKLLSKYKEYCDELKANNQIKYYTISKMVNSPDLNYERFGFRKLEEMWEQ